MNQFDDTTFDRPIPGMSMTHELGARPWQTPPTYATIEEASDYYIERMSNPKFKEQLLDVMEMKIPLTTLANTIQLASVMQGIHSIDTGLLIMPVLMELMMLIAEQNDVEYITGMERNKKEEIKESVMQNALAKFQKEQDNETDDEVLDKVEVMPQEESMSGLMARRVK